MGAKTANLASARYGAATLSQDNQQHEQMRQGHYRGSIFLHNNPIGGKTPPLNPYLLAASEGAKKAGDLRISGFPPAEAIQPN